MHQDRYVWDDDKYFINLKKHGVTFDEATSVFDDYNALYFVDEKHSDNEERFVVIGMSKHLNTLVVCHCYRNGDVLIRIISARKATSQEQLLYRRRK